jgi:D-sedoheptulose 7-phosphate isomerase
MIKDIREQIEHSLAAKQALLADAALLAQLEKLVRACIDSLRNGGKIIFAGNGGSFADAQHLSAEFVSRFAFDRAPLASLALATNSSAISAIGNDYGYEQVFERELRAVAKPGDVFIPISTSGNSANILAAAIAAKGIGVITVALTGKDGGKLKTLCECIRIPAEETARVQECHILLGHILCGLVEKDYFR